MKKKTLIEIEYEDEETSPSEIRASIVNHDTVYNAIIYKNKECLCVDESSKQCLNCPAYFTQEN
jgi:hypothetical protein